MSAPSVFISPSVTRVMLAVLRVYARDGRATLQSVAAEAGVAFSTARHHLCELREAGLATWDEGRQGTLRPLVWPTAAAS